MQNEKPVRILSESCTKYRSEAPNALFLKRSWSDFDPQAYYRYGEDQNHETRFKDKALQAAVDSWCKIQVLYLTKQLFLFLLVFLFSNQIVIKEFFKDFHSIYQAFLFNLCGFYRFLCFGMSSFFWI